MVEVEVHQKKSKIQICYAHSNIASKYIKQNLAKIKGQTDKYVIIRVDFNTLSNR